MQRDRYVVTEKGAAQGRLFGRTVAEGQELWLTEGEATTPLEQGFIQNSNESVTKPELVEFIKPQSMGKSEASLLLIVGQSNGPLSVLDPPRDPLDHDGNGRKGGSLKGSRHRRSP